jgi:hypothetical protein
MNAANNTFATAVAIPVPSGDALLVALVILANHGFTITDRDEHSAHLVGPGLHSTNPNPLLGASRIHLEMRDQQLRLQAELGGVHAMRRFIIRFPLLLGLVLGVLFALGGWVLGQPFPMGVGVPGAREWKWFALAMAAGLLPVAPWLFLGPVIASMVRTRTERALTSLVQNAVRMTKVA